MASRNLIETKVIDPLRFRNVDTDYVVYAVSDEAINRTTPNEIHQSYLVSYFTSPKKGYDELDSNPKREAYNATLHVDPYEMIPKSWIYYSSARYQDADKNHYILQKMIEPPVSINVVKGAPYIRLKFPKLERKVDHRTDLFTLQFKANEYLDIRFTERDEIELITHASYDDHNRPLLSSDYPEIPSSLKTTFGEADFGEIAAYISYIITHNTEGLYRPSVNLIATILNEAKKYDQVMQSVIENAQYRSKMINLWAPLGNLIRKYFKISEEKSNRITYENLTEVGDVKDLGPYEMSKARFDTLKLVFKYQHVTGLDGNTRKFAELVANPIQSWSEMINYFNAIGYIEPTAEGMRWLESCDISDRPSKLGDFLNIIPPADLLLGVVDRLGITLLGAKAKGMLAERRMYQIRHQLALLEQDQRKTIIVLRVTQWLERKLAAVNFRSASTQALITALQGDKDLMQLLILDLAARQALLPSGGDKEE